jgi:hypothetical protein
MRHHPFTKYPTTSAASDQSRQIKLLEWHAPFLRGGALVTSSQQKKQATCRFVNKLNWYGACPVDNRVFEKKTQSIQYSLICTLVFVSANRIQPRARTCVCVCDWMTFALERTERAQSLSKWLFLFLTWRVLLLQSSTRSLVETLHCRNMHSKQLVSYSFVPFKLAS